MFKLLAEDPSHGWLDSGLGWSGKQTEKRFSNGQRHLASYRTFFQQHVSDAYQRALRAESGKEPATPARDQEPPDRWKVLVGYWYIFGGMTESWAHHTTGPSRKCGNHGRQPGLEWHVPPQVECMYGCTSALRFWLPSCPPALLTPTGGVTFDESDWDAKKPTTLRLPNQAKL
jgi:hypothetical protein